MEDGNKKLMRMEIDDYKLKKIEIGILEILNAFCQKYHLTYYLTYGTLIGALRHNGFIPWDDDIDVMMPRSDYNKLVDSFNSSEYAKDIKLLSHSIDKKYYLPMAKLVDNRTVLKEDVAFDYEMGVYLDIFPLENLGNNIDEARFRMKKGFRYNEKLQLKSMKWRKGRSIIKNLALMIGKAVFAGASTENTIEDLERYCQEKSCASFTKYVGVMSGISKGDDSRIFEKEWFEQSIIVTFEGGLYPAPIGADKLLKKLYGDYMRLPPEEQRISHHSFEAWIKE